MNDQIYLSKEGATDRDILARRREFASPFRIQTGFGVSYRFGSMLNNFVNPRFDDAD
jgi:hypothetical protein